MSYIIWHVEDYTIHSPVPRTVPTIEVSLTGFVNNIGAYKSRTTKEIIDELTDALNRFNKPRIGEALKTPNVMPEINRVIFNPPATIVKWSDGTKTVVKCGENDFYDPEKGLAMAIVKKTMGNQGNYNNVFKKWCGPWWEQEDKYAKFLADFYNNVMDGLVNRDDIEKVSEEEPKSRWMIYYRNVETGTPEDFYDYAYSSKYSAERAARRMFGDPAMGAYTWRVVEV